jgi:hypothetical protein
MRILPYYDYGIGFGLLVIRRGLILINSKVSNFVSFYKLLKKMYKCSEKLYFFFLKGRISIFYSFAFK